MPAMIPLGWFHTAMGAFAVLCGIYTLYRHREILLENRSGLLYVLATLATAVTALMIFQRGTFGPGHALAILTLGALLVGTVAATTRLFGRFSRYLQAISYSATLLFHMIPAITDGLMRLPIGDPVLDSIESPVLKGFYAAFLLCYLVGVTLQLRWIAKSAAVRH
ncbi:MAG TPA: hypothetical protein VFG52_08015 [Xanthomonadales bacterium]|nr:hypothetical protein [Xanthomonadales bacterium]